MSDVLTLFDLPSRPPRRSFSVHPWKTRLLLNFKGIDYKTQWVEYPEIAEALEDHVTAHDEGWPYTIPAVRFPDDTWMMDSRKIAAAIEARYPSPSARLDSPYQAKMDNLVSPLIFKVFGLIIKEVPDNLLNKSSEEYWNEDRADLVGMPVDQFAEQKGGQNALDAARESMEQITELYKENNEGPFLEGKTPIYADFLWISFLYFMQVANPAWFDSFLETTGDAKLHEGILAASSPYLERSDH